MSFVTEQWEKNRKQFILAVLGVAVILLVGALYAYWQKKLRTYQAVFLTTNQVYFGNLSDEDDRYATLTNVFYLQLPAGGSNQQPQLVKLGSELHSPMDEIRINREHIIMIQDLSETSQVSRSIEAFKESQKK